MSPPALAAHAAEPADPLDHLISTGAEVTANGEIIEAIADPSGEITRYLVTDDDIGVELDPATLPTEVANGDRVEAVVEIPGQVIADLEDAGAATVAADAEDIEAGPVDQSSEAGAVLLEAAADAGVAVGLAEATVVQSAPTAALPAVGTHHLRFVFMSAAGLGKFLDSAALDEYVDQLEKYWIRESHGAIAGFTYSWADSAALTSTTHCSGTFSNIVEEAAAALGLTRSAATTTRNHLIILSPNTELWSCGGGAYQGVAMVGYQGLASGGPIHMYLDAGSGSSSSRTTVHEFGHNLGLYHAGTGTCPTGVVDGPFTSQGPCTIDHNRNDNYGDYRNVMGFGSEVGTTLNGYQKSYFGLISVDHGLVDAASDLDREFTLAPSSTTDLEAAQTIRVIDRSGGGYKQYWVDYDLQAGGIAIRRACRGIGDADCEVPAANAPNTRILSPGTTTALAPRQVFVSGETFVSQTGQFRLQVGSLTETGATFRLTLAGQSSVHLSSTTGTAPYQQSSQSIQVTTASGRWSAVSNAPSWLSVSPTSGTSGQMVSIVSAANTSTTARTGTVTFSSGGDSTDFRLTQSGVPDDHGSTVATASVWDLAASSTVSGSLELGADIDYFKITAPVSGKYTFTSNATGNPTGYLYSAAGSQLASNADSGPGYNFQLTPTLTAGTTYYLAIRNSSQSTTNTGPYTITAVVPQPSSVAVTVSNWAPAQTGGTVSLTVTTNQSSWSASSSASWLTISSRSGSTGKAITLTAARNATTTARSAVATFTAGGAVAEVLVYQPGAVDDHGSDPATATAWDLAAAATVSGNLELSDDLDYFVFTAPASGSYRFVSEATGNVSGYLYNSAASRIAYNLDSGPGSNFQITHTLTAGQVYYLAIRNSSQSTSNTGPYTITATRP
ncbi:MAG: hypothetical protein LBD70_00325 [Bifidobacteriaceae bacterium]|nr:hypothetical protein [Bifidobacteriaceae bacterium]